jgi:Delta24-sterol reductase
MNSVEPCWLSVFLLLVHVCISYGSLDSTVHASFAVDRSVHDAKVSELSRKCQTNSNLSPGSVKRINIKRTPSESHCPRPHDYKEGSLQLDLSDFRKVIDVTSIDSLSSSSNRKVLKDISRNFDHMLRNGDIAGVADVQCMCDMEVLVDALLPLGMIPAVVPEFKGITIGGSIQGLAAESTSFKYGFVHDTVLGFELLLPSGEVKWCSRNENRDLFHAVPGSFGSLGICTRAKILCIKAKSHVLVHCKRHHSHARCVEYMGDIQDACLQRARNKALETTNNFLLASLSLENEIKPKLDFMEGLGYSSNEFVSLLGGFVDQEEVKFLEQVKVHKFHCSGWGDKWFYNQIRDIMPNLSPLQQDDAYNLQEKEKASFAIYDIKSYLFRHDRGSFWMASFRIPQFVASYIMGDLLDNTNMFKLANALPWAFPKSQILLQDFMLPREQVVSFFRILQQMLTVWPVWLLPMRHIREKDNIFGAPPAANGHLCNCGIYGIPKQKVHQKRYNFVRDNKKLEELLTLHFGRKVFYSHAFYHRDFFYEFLYNGKVYRALRDRYVPNKELTEIFDKIITKNNKL